MHYPQHPAYSSLPANNRHSFSLAQGGYAASLLSARPQLPGIALRTVFDLQDHWELFEDPNDPSKGALHNCTIGSQCTEINRVKLEAYGLARYFNAVSPASYASLAATLAAAQDQQRPVLGYYWAPTALMGAYDWYVLEEPAYSDECWGPVIAAANGESASPEEACAYETLAWAVANAIGDDWEQAAVHYFRTYEDRWRGWVTPEAYERISEALEEG